MDTTVDRTAKAAAPTGEPAETGARAGTSGGASGEASGEALQDGIPQQRGATTEPTRRPCTTATWQPWQYSQPWQSWRSWHPWRLLPTPTGTPFTFSYVTVLLVTSLIAEHADPSLVHALHQGSSTDVAHLVQNPVPALVASALWVVGGVMSPYGIGFLLALTALERRVGGMRTAGVFLLGHVLATLGTEIPVGLSVLAGHLPESSLHRLDYGISFGVAASVGALAGLLPPWFRWTVLLTFGGVLVAELIEFTDPLTNWGHLLALVIGVAAWPLVRRPVRRGRDTAV
ncbi:rhomboid-like protein [Streptomyces acidicola]|uniref:rhomboid-like protein n=1 Tax=Streptomyces acidicola TaxID=2596892 RepID=UPI003430A203